MFLEMTSFLGKKRPCWKLQLGEQTRSLLGFKAQAISNEVTVQHHAIQRQAEHLKAGLLEGH